MKFRNCVAYLLLLAGLLCAGAGFAQTTAFTYQGRLTDNGAPASGNYDLRFTTYDALAAGNLVAGPLTNQLVMVTNGLFTVSLDFGNSFDGSDRWLEIGVRPGGSNTVPFTALIPRQAITPTPYALLAQTVPAGGIQGTVADTNLSANVARLNQQQTYTAPIDLNVDGGSVPLTVTGDPNNPANLLEITAPANTNVLVVNAQGFLGINTTNPTAMLTINANNGYNVVSEFLSPSVGWPGNSTFHFDVNTTPQSYQYHGTNFNFEKQFCFWFNRDNVGQRQSPDEPMFGNSLETDWIDPDSGERQVEYYLSYVSPGGEWSGRPEGWVMRKNYLSKVFLADNWGIYDANNNTLLTVGDGSGRTIATGQFGGVGSASMHLYGLLNIHTNAQNSGGLSLSGGVLNIADTTGTNYTSIFQSPPGNQNGLVISSAYPAQNLTIQGFGQMTINQTAVLQPLGVTTNVPLLLQGYNGQNTNLLEVRDYAYNLKAAIDQNGNLFASGISGISGLVTNNYPGAAFTTPFSLNSPNHNNIVQFFSNDDGKVFEDFNGYLRIGGNGYLMLKSGSSAVFNGPTGSTYFGQEIYGGNFFEINNEVNSVMRIRGFSKVMPVTPLHINGGFGDMASNAVALTVTAPVNASADLQQWQSSGGGTLARVDKQGNGYFANFRAGVTNIADMDTNVVVTFSLPLSSTNYSVVVTPEFNTGGATWWVDTKTTNGFNFNLSAGVAGGGNVSWQAVLGQ
jgi:hypothetical protein